MEMPTITAFDTGWLRTQRRTLLAVDDRTEIDIPVPSWFVRHRDGDVMFDVGLHPSLSDGPDSLGAMAKLFTPLLAEGGTVGARLAAHDVDPAGALTVVLSHCHFDHCGGLCELPNARVIVHADEWRAAQGDESIGGYDRSLYDLGHDVTTVDGEHDLFGDGTIVTLPTPGHTHGHHSLRVETTDGPVILASDACYFTDTLDDGIQPPFGFDLKAQAASLAMLRRQRAAGARIVPGHDATDFRTWTDAHSRAPAG